MNADRRLWLTLGVIMIVSFAVLGLMGGEIYRTAPPVPDAVVTESDRTLFTRDDIQTGRQVWQSIGGQQVGSIWGHGAYLAPDWSADWLHREAVALLELWADRDHGLAYAELPSETQAGLRERLKQHVRSNGYDPVTDTLVLSDDRAAAIEEVAAHYVALFGADPAFTELRDAYALAENPIPDADRRAAMTSFFFWTAWAAAANRPGDDITYTSNWPPEPLLDLAPTPAGFMWTVISIVLLLAGAGALCWYYAATRASHDPAPVQVPDSDPLQGLKPTPSMRATAKYFWTVIGLLGLQVVLGGITAHYSVEGQAFYGFNLAEILPYAVTRTWHTQLAVFWIATAWLATGLYIAPAISGHEPRFQRLLVNVLYVCLLIIVLGSMAGEWLGVQQKLGLDVNFWFGHQGYEYVDLGRFWQIFLFAGLMIWLTLVCRALWPALRRRDESRHLVLMLFLSTVAIGLFYGAGLMWGKHTHLALVEYWRWWVVHLWVEGFFEVFATAVIAFLFTRLGLLGARFATTAVLFSTVVFLTGGILGTFHHLYFTGTPTAVLALGATFSALEVVPLVLIGFEAYENYKLSRSRAWVQTYKWPILFFIAVAFWNLVGAGVFGFLINPPLSLYYMQGLNTTANHGHTALFGVYGMLGLGLMLFCLRGLVHRAVWDERILKLAFWSLNGGVAAMALLSLLPVGLIQVYASVKHGLWYARSAELIHSPAVETLVWMRVPGDIVFSLGVAAIAWFVMRLYWPARSRAERLPLTAPATEAAR